MGFSERTAWPREENRLSRAMGAARRAWGDRAVDLTVSNPTEAQLAYDRERLLGALREEALFHYEPSPLGTASARAAIADYYARRELDIDPERLVVVASTSEAYTYLFRLLADPGDEVLIPSPSYPLFEFLTSVSDVCPRPYSIGFDGEWYFDFDSLERASTPRTRALLVVSPNNPTGTIATPSERARLIDFAQRRDLAIISDEVFADFSVGVEHAGASMIGTSELLSFSLGGLSKSAGLPQMKAGWIAINGPSDLASEARARLELIADTFLSVSTPAQLLLPVALERAEAWQDALRARLETNRSTLRGLTRGTALSVRPSQGGWSAILDVPELATDEEWALGLADERGVLVHPGYLFELAGRPTLVLSLLPSPTRFREGVERLVLHVQEACTGSS